MPDPTTDLTPLLGQRVIVTSPNGARWAGTLTALADQPTAVIDLADGGRVSLPQSHTYTVVPRPEDELRQHLAAATTRAELAEEMYLAAARRGDRHRAAWRSARQRAARETKAADTLLTTANGYVDDLAAAETRAEQAEAALADEHATAVTRAHETEQVRRQLAAVEARIAAVRAIHRRVTTAHTDSCEHCSAGDYPNYDVRWPCPTAAALDGPDRSECECPEFGAEHDPGLCARSRHYAGVCDEDGRCPHPDHAWMPRQKQTAPAPEAALEAPAETPAETPSLAGLDADTLTQLIRDAQYRRAVLDPDRCPADCAEGHTYEVPCSGATPGSDNGQDAGDIGPGYPNDPDGPADTPAAS
jgi:hypothetical protein